MVADARDSQQKYPKTGNHFAIDWHLKYRFILNRNERAWISWNWNVSVSIMNVGVLPASVVCHRDAGRTWSRSKTWREKFSIKKCFACCAILTKDLLVMILHLKHPINNIYWLLCTYSLIRKAVAQISFTRSFRRAASPWPRRVRRFSWPGFRQGYHRFGTRKTRVDSNPRAF